MLIMPSFKKSLIGEQFQGNYLKISLVWLRAAIIILDKATKISLYTKKGDKDKKEASHLTCSWEKEQLGLRDFVFYT